MDERERVAEGRSEKTQRAKERERGREAAGRERGEKEERALGFREYYLVSVDNDTSASFYSPHQL